VSAIGILGAASRTARAQDRAPEVSYRFDLNASVVDGEILGRGEISLVNSGTFSLDRVPLVLYPNRFRTQDPRIRDETFGRYYSFRFHSGEIRLESVTDARDRPLEIEARRLVGFPEGTYIHVKLREPVRPGATVRLKVAFKTVVPDRYGMFGKRGRRLILEGGVWPLVPLRDRTGTFRPDAGPMLGRNRITVEASEGTVVLGGVATNEDPTILSRTVFVAAGQDLDVLKRLPARPQLQLPELVYRGPADHADRAAHALDVTEQAAVRFWRDWLPKGPAGDPIVLVEAPLRDRLVHVAGDTILVSDRLFEVFSHFSGFHVRELTRAVFELLARRQLALEQGEGEDRRWVAEAVAWIALEEWQKGQAGVNGALVRERLGILDFIPSIDALLHAPRGLPSSDLYFGRIYEPYDNVRDELERMGSPRPRGRLIAEKLRDKIGNAKLAELARATLGRGGIAGATFRERASSLAHEKMREFFELWLGLPPRENLAIDKREEVRLPDGSEGIAVHLRRDTTDKRIGEVGEPVTVDIQTTEGHDRATWDGKGDTGVVILPRHGFFYGLDVDPEQRLDEDYRGDNQWPYFAKLLVNRFSFSIDLNGGNRSSVDAGFTLHPLFDYHQSILVDGFYAGEGRGGRLTYAYHFGQQIDQITFGNTVWGSFLYESLGTGLIRNAPLFESTGRLGALAMGVALETRTDNVRPTHGGRLAVSFELADSSFAGEFTYSKAQAGAVYVFTPIRPFTFTFGVNLGQVYGSSPPTQALFDLGGDAGGVRGCRTGDFIDRAELVFKSELRLSALEDLDWNIIDMDVVFWRRLELIGFCDAGGVGPGVSEVLRDTKDWKVGAGPGIAWEVDAFGIKAVLLRFDVGWRCDSHGGHERGIPQYYFQVGESF
jgi:hypothetical protein